MAELEAERAAREHHISVRRTARYYTLGGGGSLEDVWIVCHGYGQLAAKFIRPFAAIATPERVVVAPEALNRYYVERRPVAHGPDSVVGATWMTREDREREMDDYVAYLDVLRARVMGRGPASPPVTALGFSQGAATAARWAARAKRPVQRVVLWGAGLPAELLPSLDLFQGARLTFVHGTADHSVSDAARVALRERLAASGLDAEFMEFSGGHHLHTASLRKLAEAG